MNDNSKDESETGTRDSFDPTNSTMVWNEIARCLDSFVELWESSTQTPPACDAVLNTLDRDIKAIAIIELIKLDMDYRVRSDFPPLRIEDYVAQFPDLLSVETIGPDLIYEEYHLRRQAGESVSVDEYVNRFPAQAAALKRLMNAESTSEPTTLYNRKRKPDFEPGQQVDDFDLIAKLGKGAFATVFLARQRSLQRLVALKISENQGTEPQTLARLDHPNIVRVYDQVVLPGGDWRLLYMKYVPGGTLQDVISFSRESAATRRDGSTLVRAVDQQLDLRGETPPRISAMRMHWLDSSWAQTVCDLGVQMADALECAHDQGVLHRDLKPANILLTAEAAPQLVDFNISFCSKLDGASPAAFFGGSLAYMSPEQMEACDPDNDREPESLAPTSDIYSLAIVLWEVYFGRRPFPDKSMEGGWSNTLQAFAEARKSDPLPVADLMKRADPQRDALLEVLRRCLRFDAKDRIQNAAQLKYELQLAANLPAKRILRPTQEGILGFAQRRPFITSTILLLIPNLAAGLFNLLYNVSYVLEEVCQTAAAEEFARERFFRIQAVINLIAFPVGTLLIFLGHRPIANAVLAMRRGEVIESQQLRNLRHRALQFGTYVVIVVVTIWALAGIAYPLAMQLSGVPLTMRDRLHFFISLVLSGIMGNAYPYIAQSYFSLRSLYPNLIDERDETHLDDIEPLKKLIRHCYGFLVLAIMLPMFAVMLISSMGGASYQRALLIISLISLFGTAIAFRYTRIVRNAAETLINFYRENAARR